MRPIKKWVLWLGIVVATLVAWIGCAHFHEDPYQAAGSAQFLFVRNAYPDTAYLALIAEDGTTRNIVVAPSDSACFRMPFTDQVVRVVLRVGLHAGQVSRRVGGPGETWLLIGDQTPVTAFRCYRGPAGPA